jgi:hypothetical protein
MSSGWWNPYPKRFGRWSRVGSNGCQRGIVGIDGNPRWERIYPYRVVAAAFTRANTDINQALDIIARKLEPLLEVQQKAGDVGAKIIGLTDQIDAA